MERDNKDDKKDKDGTKMPKFNLTWVYVLVTAVLAYMFWFGPDNGSYKKEIPYSDFQEYVRKGYASEITVNKGHGNVQMFVAKDFVDEVFAAAADSGEEPSVVAEFPALSTLDEFLTAQKEAGNLNCKITYKANTSIFSNPIVSLLLSALFFVAIWMFFIRRMGGGGSSSSGIFNVGKAKAQLYEKAQTNAVTFKDVAGQDEAKQEIMEIVKFLKNPQKYTELGGKIPKGALLVGPPGTGKTLLAKAVAGEAGVPFFSISGSDFVEMFVGVGASRVRDLFKQAKEKTPCIVFIDEIDAVGRARGRNPQWGGNDERESTLNQLLTEMDGFGTNSGIIVLAATNRADILDKALLRAGRFDRQIHVELPGLPERKQIFKVHMKPVKIDSTVDVDLLARQTPGFSGADIANVCNEAALIAARGGKDAVQMQDFLDAIDRIIGGLEKKTKVMTGEEKRTIALHEAGHATVSWFLEYANPLVKVTIVPRGQALGAAWYLPEERTITTREQMLDELCATLGGRAAEELVTGHISSGALNDLETVTKRAFGMVAYLGMSERLPNLCYYSSDQSYGFEKPYSGKTAELIDDEVKRIIAEQYERAKKILTEHAEGHKALADVLIEKEVIFAEDVEKIFGKRPWVSRTEEILKENARIEAEREARLKAATQELMDREGAENKVKGELTAKKEEKDQTEEDKSEGEDTQKKNDE